MLQRPKRKSNADPVFRVRSPCPRRYRDPPSVPAVGKKLTYEEYQTLVRDAKEQAWQELSEVEQREITETAKVSAGELLIPDLVSLGFENILIEYRPSFSVKDVMMEKR